MTEPILVVDIGTAVSSAAIVAEGRTGLLRDPYSGANAWPSAILLDDTRPGAGPGAGPGWLVGTAAERRKRAAPRHYVDGPRRAVDARAALRLADREVTGAEAMRAYLSTIADEAHHIYGSPIRRLVLTVPADYAGTDDRRDALVAIGEAAGFAEVELVDETVAVAFDPHTGADLPNGSLVLVFDLGVTWTVALVHLRGNETVQLAQHGAPTGRDLDALLLADLRSEGRTWLEPLLGAPGDAGLRAYHEAIDFVRGLKHRLADADEVQDHLTPFTPAYRLTRQWLEAFAAPAVSTLVAGAHTVVASAGATLADLGAVILSGGAARLPVTVTALTEALGHPLRRSAEPEFAVVRGAARWASGAPGRVIAATGPGWRTEPVVWDLPPGPVRLLRWALDEGMPYPAGSVLAQIRTPDDRVLGLTAPRAGILVGHRPAAGEQLGAVLAVAARRPAQALALDPPPLRHSLETAGSFLLSADRHVLLECDAAGTSVRSTVAGTGELLGVFAPEPPWSGPAAKGGGRVFVDPEGRPALVCWDDEGGVAVWDIQSGKLTVRMPDAIGGRRVLVDESAWRLAVESEGRAAVGRYRRSTVTVWDLHTGGRVEKATDGAWEARHPHFGRRSAADGLTAEAVSPDGQLHAAVRPDGVLLTDAETGLELLRVTTPGTVAAAARVAFDGDGRRLLTAWERDGWSQIDVHEI
jgi:molecular chaperone DnaK